MKTLISLAVATLSAPILGAGLYQAFQPQPAEAGLFSSAATSDWKTKEPKNFLVAAYGWDLRVYEWQSETNPAITCSTVFAEAGPVGYQCFDTE